LVEDFRTVVQIPVLAIFDTGQELAEGRTIALELIRDDHRVIAS
jgi:hypothetical protein